MSDNQIPTILTENVGPAADTTPAVENTTVATPVVPEVPKPPALDPSREFAAISKQRRELLERENALKARSALVEKYEKLEAKKKEDPYGFLEEHGLDFDAVTQAALNRPEAKGPETVEEKLARIEKSMKDKEQAELDAIKKADEQKQQAEIQKQVNEYANKLTDIFKSSPDEYEQILLENAQEEVLNYVIGYYNKTLAEDGEGIVLDPKEAADKIEAHLVERNKVYAEKLFASKKLGLQREKQQPTPAPTRSHGATLSQNLTPITGNPPPRNETREQKMARIVAEFEAKNKS